MDVDLELEGIAKRLRMARAATGMTQLRAAAEAGISPSVLSLYEHARRDPLSLAIKRLARAYGVSVDWLMCVEGAPMRRA